MAGALHDRCMNSTAPMPWGETQVLSEYMHVCVYSNNDTCTAFGDEAVCAYG